MAFVEEFRYGGLRSMRASNNLKIHTATRSGLLAKMSVEFSN